MNLIARQCVSFLLFLAIALWNACAGPGRYNAVAPSQRAGKKGATMADTLTLTDADQGTSHSVAVGQGVTIRLGENPTTGYRWTLDAEPANAVELLGSEYIGVGAAPGAAGTREFHLRTKAPGSVHLHFRLSRSWQGEGPAAEAREFTLQVAP